MSRYTVLASDKDSASIGIAEALQRSFPSLDTRIISKDLTDAIDDNGMDRIIFASRHESQSKTPALLTHAPGNWGEPFHGGMRAKLCPTDAQLMRRLILELRKRVAGTRYQAIQECTHHGPYVEKPAIFAEIGSDTDEWNDANAATIMAESLNHAMDGTESATCAIGVGGPHYAPAFNKLIHTYAFGHICPKYALKHLNEDMLSRAISMSGAEIAVIDWKGLGSEKNRIIKLLQDSGIKFIKNTDVKSPPA